MLEILNEIDFNKEDFPAYFYDTFERKLRNSLSDLDDSKSSLDVKLNELVESIEFVVRQTHSALEKFDKFDESAEQFFDNQMSYKNLFKMLARQLIDMQIVDEKPLDQEAERRFLHILKLLSEQRVSLLKLGTYSYLINEMRNKQVHKTCRIEFLAAIIRTMHFQIGLRYKVLGEGELSADKEDRLRHWKNYVNEILNFYRATMENFFGYLQEDRFLQLITEIQNFYE
jgi:hypothetical protein